MALALDPQSPLQENLSSFDCEDSNSLRQQPVRKKLAGKLAQSIFLSVGIILLMAVVGTPGMFDPRAIRNFASHVLSPSRPSATAVNTIPQTPIGHQTSQPLPDVTPIGHQTVKPLPGGNEQGLTPAAPAVAAPSFPSAGAPPNRRAPTLTMLSTSTEQVGMLLSLIGLGKLLQGRFPDKEPDVIQKFLLQFLFPASLFKGLSSLSLQFSQLGYVAAGFGLVLARLACGWAATRAIFGGSKDEDVRVLRRTSVFQFSTSSYALSVMPFVSEFIGGDFVGLGSLVDLSMKMYMLIVLPVVLEMCGSGAIPSGNRGGFGKKVKYLLTDPITLSLILGLIAAAATGGGGCAALGFVGRGIINLAGAQTAVLFLLLGLKLKLDNDSPLFSLILFCGVQGALLMLAGLICFAIPMSPTMQQFICYYSQGAPSIVGLGIIAAAKTAGVKGYSTTFAFDILALACPLSALLQCFGGIMGPAFPSLAGIVGAGLIGVAGLLRILFRNKFRRDGGGDKFGTPQAALA